MAGSNWKSPAAPLEALVALGLYPDSHRATRKAHATAVEPWEAKADWMMPATPWAEVGTAGAGGAAGSTAERCDAGFAGGGVADGVGAGRGIWRVMAGMIGAGWMLAMVAPTWIRG